MSLAGHNKFLLLVLSFCWKKIRVLPRMWQARKYGCYITYSYFRFLWIYFPCNLKKVRNNRNITTKKLIVSSLCANVFTPHVRFIRCTTYCGGVYLLGSIRPNVGVHLFTYVFSLRKYYTISKYLIFKKKKWISRTLGTWLNTEA